MVKYFWSKHKAELVWQNPDDIPWGQQVKGLAPYGLVIGSALNYSPTSLHGIVITGNIATVSSGQNAIANYYWTQSNSTTDPTHVDLSQVTAPTATKSGSAWEVYYKRKRIVKLYEKGVLIQSNITAEEGAYPTNGRHSDGYWYVRGALANTDPTATLNTANNVTLYENDLFRIEGNAQDTDAGNIVNVYYQINNGTVRAIATKIADGTPVEFGRELTFRGGKLHYNDTAVTDSLAEGTAHTLKVWSEDNQGGKSEVLTRSFYVVPNRPPSLTMDPIEDIIGLIDADKFTVTGTSFDADGNDVVVRYRINNGINVEIHNGPAGEFSFDIPVSKLKDGANDIVVEVSDTYNFKSSKTIKLNKSANLTPLAHSVQRWTINPPAGSAQGVLFWIKRDESQDVSIEISMTTGTEPENFVPMDFDSSGPDEIGTVEDFFKYRADSPAEKIAIKISWTGDKPIHQIQGALTQ